MEAFPTLSIGPLVATKDLRALASNWVEVLLNVSAIDIEEIYERDATDCFEIHSFRFRDIFAQRHTSFDEWEQFKQNSLGAVDAAVHKLAEVLREGRRVHCFCAEGRSRSSIVSAGALIVAFGLDATTAMDMVQLKNERAEFGKRAVWYLQRLVAMEEERMSA